MKKFFTALLYLLIIGIMVWVIAVRFLRGCSIFRP